MYVDTEIRAVYDSVVEARADNQVVVGQYVVADNPSRLARAERSRAAIHADMLKPGYVAPQELDHNTHLTAQLDLGGEYLGRLERIHMIRLRRVDHALADPSGRVESYYVYRRRQLARLAGFVTDIEKFAPVGQSVPVLLVTDTPVYRRVDALDCEHYRRRLNEPIALATILAARARHRGKVAVSGRVDIRVGTKFISSAFADRGDPRYIRAISHHLRRLGLQAHVYPSLMQHFGERDLRRLDRRHEVLERGDPSAYLAADIRVVHQSQKGPHIPRRYPAAETAVFFKQRYPTALVSRGERRSNSRRSSSDNDDIIAKHNITPFHIIIFSKNQQSKPSRIEPSNSIFYNNFTTGY